MLRKTADFQCHTSPTVSSKLDIMDKYHEFFTGTNSDKCHAQNNIPLPCLQCSIH